MALDFLHERQQAHSYLDRLPLEQLSAVRRLLETMLDPVSRALANAPVEDEEIEFGLTMEDFEKMSRTRLPPEPNGSAR
jgi:hypothetical protein